MTKRPMTNIEKVTHVMSYSNYGALAQMFVMEALLKWSEIVSKADPKKVDNGFISGEAWVGVAKEVQDTLRTELTINDSDLEEDETPFGEIHFDCGPAHSHRITALEPTNAQRAQWATNALAVFSAETYSGDHPGTMHPGDMESAIGDLICDLLHLAARKDMDASAIHEHARRMFEQEVAEEVGCDCADRSGYGPDHDTQCPAGIAAAKGQQKRPNACDLVEALDMLLWSLSPRKIIPVLKAAGYSTDLWKAAHKNAAALLKKFKQ